MCAAVPTPGVPDLHHPYQYRKSEALWKKQLSQSHLAFCLCGNFLNHFRWPTGEGDGGNRGDRDGGPIEERDTGEDLIGATGGGGDISDHELLQ
uniref:ORF2 n=1 Tax=Torque teno Leptonychotes weddellii virus-1 TaxID=2012676 RepID=A0A1Z2RVW1_9VIRU|nr:ORF2 [Torque teno Leptonychotes weddellii virus 1]